MKQACLGFFYQKILLPVLILSLAIPPSVTRANPMDHPEILQLYREVLHHYLTEQSMEEPSASPTGVEAAVELELSRLRLKLEEEERKGFLDFRARWNTELTLDFLYLIRSRQLEALNHPTLNRHQDRLDSSVTQVTQVAHVTQVTTETDSSYSENPWLSQRPREDLEQGQLSVQAILDQTRQQIQLAIRSGQPRTTSHTQLTQLLFQNQLRMNRVRATSIGMGCALILPELIILGICLDSPQNPICPSGSQHAEACCRSSIHDYPVDLKTSTPDLSCFNGTLLSNQANNLTTGFCFSNSTQTCLQAAALPSPIDEATSKMTCYILSTGMTGAALSIGLIINILLQCYSQYLKIKIGTLNSARNPSRDGIRTLEAKFLRQFNSQINLNYAGELFKRYLFLTEEH